MNNDHAKVATLADGTAPRRFTSHVSRLTSQVLKALILGFAAYGCSHVTRPEQVQQSEGAPAEVFLHEHLPREPIVTVGEGYRALLMLADGEERFTTFEERESELVRRGVVRSQWGLERDQGLDHGSAAYMVMQILRITGGVNVNTLGRLGIGDRRYAMRELGYMDLMPPGPPYRYMTGSELVDLMARADEYMVRKGMYELRHVDIEQEVEQQKQSAATQPR